jgi:EAL domain-containing protein (putative c-di-GMP-specific phosphodiesterase class I)
MLIAEKILDSVALPYNLNGNQWRSASSIGITVFGENEMGVNEILQQADIAMYQAKEAGRNTISVFAPELRAVVVGRASAEEELRQAIENNQFVLHYQPQVKDGRLIGAEALLRWHHPSRGVILPGEFIPLAERTSLILPLGRWVLESACSQLAAWASVKETAHIEVAVNISVRQMSQPDFVGEVLRILKTTGARPKNLRLELTESMFVEHFDEIIRKMTDLKTYGVKFSIDDFGTGFSSLSYLKYLPIDQLKIERTFVQDIVEDASSSAIAESIILMSRALGLSVVAEGVETEAQRKSLIGLGCNSFQGWLISQPLPVQEFQAMC